ncbi:MAG: PIN domain-containing protein [Gemmatimonadota bacterium]|nr:PIN domain-containing protein [Gemmatimonadota bacterium]
MIVADTGAIIALIDADDRHHEALVKLYDADPAVWVLPWAILPEVDYLLTRRVGDGAALAFRADLASGAFTIAWGSPEDLARAHALCVRYADLALGLVDAVVAAIAERLRARAIATVDLRDFGPLMLKGSPKLFPRDQA